MLLDIFDNDNSLTINYVSIRIFGLVTSCYISELISINKKAIKKNKINDGYFKLDRNYITKILGLSVEEQLICDSNLMKVSILKKSIDDPDIIKLNINLYVSLLSFGDNKLYEDVSAQMKILRPKGLKITQRQQEMKRLQDSIVCSNYELLTALRDWVESIYANPKGWLSKLAIRVFQTTLNNYTKGNLDMALRIVQIAAIQGYKDCSWAINIYEKDKMKNNHIGNMGKPVVKTTYQKVATKADIGDIIF